MALLPRVWVGVWLLSSGTSMPRCAVSVLGVVWWWWLTGMACRWVAGSQGSGCHMLLGF